MGTAHIWVDADSFPAPARLQILKEAAARRLPVTYAANRDIPFGMEDELFSMEICGGGNGAADDYIVSHCTAGDIVATRDIPLARRLLDKKITVINDRGTQFSETNIAELLEQRELSMQMAALGIRPGGRKNTYGNKELAAFTECLKRVLSGI
ncbi:MAG: DUF188 domain-containing protein [Treponema sp.]|jgi:hypothetical protein|nr:DUF188 domain-containing protein [Treponema sp.]